MRIMTSHKLEGHTLESGKIMGIGTEKHGHLLASQEPRCGRFSSVMRKAAY